MLYSCGIHVIPRDFISVEIGHLQPCMFHIESAHFISLFASYIHFLLFILKIVLLGHIIIFCTFRLELGPSSYTVHVFQNFLILKDDIIYTHKKEVYY